MIKRLNTFNICIICSKPFQPWKKSTGKYCSVQCWHSLPKPKGSMHPSWKGGRNEHQGYIRIHAGPKQNILEHRLVMESMLGRPMLPTEQVHHRNGIRNDNRPENLELRTGPHDAGATHHCPTCTCEQREGATNG